MIREEPETNTDIAPTGQNCFQDLAVRVKNLLFSDGQTVSIGPSDVVVFVGPNNAGKSRALLDIQRHMSNNQAGTVVKMTDFSESGTAKDLESFVKEHAILEHSAGQSTYRGYRFTLSSKQIRQRWGSNRSIFASLFCLQLSTGSRLRDSDPASGIAFRKEPANHPIHMLFLDAGLEARISQYFFRAFGAHLVVDRLGGKEVPLLVGEHIQTEGDETLLSPTYNERLLNATVPLQGQGDGMRSFASVILHLLAPITPSILLLDEPEVFLHPPQARILGEIIATKRQKRTQLFVATHSPDVLQGLLNVVEANHLRVIRIQREEDVNHIKELNRDRASEISKDPLTKYSSVLSGVFHERVIICESDSDCMFYSSLLDIPAVHLGPHPDVLFVHANGKHRIAIQVSALMELGVQVDVIVDMDILQDENDLKKLLETLGGNWEEAQTRVASVRTAIDQHKPWLTAGEVAKGIQKVLAHVPQEGEFPRLSRQKIDALFRKASPWDAIKDAGVDAIPKGQASSDFDSLKASLEAQGLWIVPVGELEGFCRKVGGHGPKWVQKVIETYHLANCDELKEARDFVRKVWSARRSLKAS